MKKLQKRMVTAIATFSLLLFSVMPASAITLEVSGNGSDSDSDISLDQYSSTTVVQTNEANIDNDVDVDADTGDNSASDNTGGEVDIETGDASVDVEVSNTANTNVAEVDTCGDCGQDVGVLIKGNGTESDNDVEVDSYSEASLFQDNYANIDNDVDVEAETGENEADDNTNSDVSIETGESDVTVELDTRVNRNVGSIGGDGDGEGGVMSVRVIGNGSDSDNDVDLDWGHSILLDQVNEADVENDVDVEAETGDNDADDNTGGEVMIETGDATADITVDTWANFNAADLGCDCLFEDVWAGIGGNGTNSDNGIAADLYFASALFQDNWEDGDNDVEADLETGDNDADDFTDLGDDPSITTGDADATIDINNSGNWNVEGDGTDMMPDMGMGDFSFDFDMNEMMMSLFGWWWMI